MCLYGTFLRNSTTIHKVYTQKSRSAYYYSQNKVNVDVMGAAVVGVVVVVVVAACY